MVSEPGRAPSSSKCYLHCIDMVNSACAVHHVSPDHVTLHAAGTYTLVHLATQVSISLFHADLLQTLLVVQGCTVFFNTPRQDIYVLYKYTYTL